MGGLEKPQGTLYMQRGIHEAPINRKFVNVYISVFP